MAKQQQSSTRFKTFDEMMKMAEQKNLQSITGEYGEIENQEAIDAAKKYNTSEESRVQQKNYDNSQIEDWRRIQAQGGQDRTKVIELQQMIQNSTGGSIDGGSYKTKVTAAYVPKEYKSEVPQFQALPNPQFQKATISRFNPNAGGSGGANQRPGVYQWLNPDGSLPARYARQRVGSFVAKLNNHKFDNYEAMKNSIAAGSSYALVNMPDMLAENYDVYNPMGQSVGQLDFLSAAVKGTSELLKHAHNGDWANRSSTQGLQGDELKYYNYYKKMKFGTPDALLGTHDFTDQSGQSHKQEVLGNGFQMKFAEGTTATGDKSVINSPTTFKVEQIAGTTGDDPNHYKIIYGVNPMWSKLVEAKTSKYLIEVQKNPDKYKKFLSDLDAHNDTVNKNDQVTLEDALEHVANAELKEQYMFDKPQYFEEMVKRNIINSTNKFKKGETYAMAPAEVYTHSGLLNTVSGMSSNSTASYPNSVTGRFYIGNTTLNGGTGSTPYTVPSKFVINN
jgi:hypothetical protein